MADVEAPGGRFSPTLLLFVLFLGVAAALAWSADASFGFGPDQISYNLLTEELVAAWEQDLPLRNEAGSLYRQSFVFLHAAGQRLLGEPVASYRLILFLSALAYLPAMYLLLASVLGDRAIAALVAVLSITQRYTLGTSYWGMGEFQSILPRIVVLAVFPLAFLHFQRHLRSRRVLESFAIVALGFALNLSAVYFYCILLLTYGLYILWNRAWSSLFDFGLAVVFFLFSVKAVPSPMWSSVAERAAATALPVALLGFGLLLGYARLRASRWVGLAILLYLGFAFAWLMGSPSVLAVTGIESGVMVDAQDRLESLNRALHARFGWALFPISAATLGFALYNGGLVAAVALYELYRRWRRGATDRERLAALYIVSVVVVSLGLTAATQLYSRITGRPDMVFELFRAFRFIYLPVYAYLGLFFQRAWRGAWARGDVRARLLLAALAAVLLLPPRQTLAGMPDSLKLRVRDLADRSGSLHVGDPSQRKYLHTLLATDSEQEAERARLRDLAQLGEWVKRSTPEASVFLTTDYEFTYYSGRDIMISYQQGAGSARSMAVARGHRAWHEAYLAISGAYESRSPERILEAARHYDVDYVVTAADQPPLPTIEVYGNASYRLYRPACAEAVAARGDRR